MGRKRTDIQTIKKYLIILKIRGKWKGFFPISSRVYILDRTINLLFKYIYIREVKDNEK